MYRWLRNTFYGLDYTRTAGKICAAPHVPATSSLYTAYSSPSSSSSSSSSSSGTLRAVPISTDPSWSSSTAYYATPSSTLHDCTSNNEPLIFSTQATSARSRVKAKSQATTEFARARANRKLINSAATSPIKKLPVINNNSNSTSSGCSSRAYSEQKEILHNAVNSRRMDTFDREEDDFYDEEYLYDEDTVTSINNYMNNPSVRQRLQESRHFEQNSHRLQAQIICENLTRMFNRHFYRNYKMRPKYMRSRYNRRSFLMNMAAVTSFSVDQQRQFEQTKSAARQYTGNCYNNKFARNLFIDRAITEANSMSSTTYVNDEDVSSGRNSHLPHVLLVETQPEQKLKDTSNFARSRSASFNNDLSVDFNNNNLSSSRNRSVQSHASNSSSTNKISASHKTNERSSNNCLSASRSNKSNASTANSNLFLDDGDLFDSFVPSCSNSVCDLNGNYF
jgi:hypothetical protein